MWREYMSPNIVVSNLHLQTSYNIESHCNAKIKEFSPHHRMLILAGVSVKSFLFWSERK